MPFTFTDAKGRVWDLTLNLAAARRIDNSDFSTLYDEKFSFLNPDQNLLRTIYAKPGLLFAIIWAVVQPQVPTVMADWFEQRGITPRRDATATLPKETYDALELEFAEGINGAAKRDGLEAFMEATGDFFPELATVLSTLNQQWKRVQNRVSQDLMDLTPEIEQQLDKVREKELAKFRRDLQTLDETPGEK